MLVNRHRACITGIGVMASIGCNKNEVAEALLDGRGGIKQSKNFGHIFPDLYTSEVSNFRESATLSSDILHKMGKCSRWAHRVTEEAIRDAAVVAGDLEKAILIVGLSANESEMLFEPTKDGVNSYELLVTSGRFASVCGIISHLFQIGGGTYLISTACTSSANGIGLAYDLIQNNRANIVIVLSPEPLSLPVVAGFYKLRNVAVGACSPFSGRSGMSLGEGAGCVVVENYDHAMKRNSHIYGEVLGYAISCDAYHETAPDPRADVAVKTAENAIRNAGLQPEEIEYINAHGTGTELNDRIEVLTLKKVFPNIADIPVSSLKSFFGHTIGAAGVLEIICSLLTLPQGIILPTINFATPRPGCDSLFHVPNQALDKSIDVFMSGNYGFGGDNCSVIMSCKPGKNRVSSYNRQRVVVTGIGILTSGIVGWDEFMCMHEVGGSAEMRKATIPSQTGYYGDEEASSFVSEIFVQGSSLNRIFGSLPLDSKYRAHLIGNINPKEYVRNYDERKSNKVTDYASIAIALAMRNGAFKPVKHEKDITGIIMGISNGSQSTVNDFMSSIHPDPNNAKANIFPRCLRSFTTTRCAALYGIRGYNSTISNGFCSSLGAVCYGYEIVRQNLQRYVFVGGADEFVEMPWFYLYSGMGLIDWSVDSDNFCVYSKEGKGFFPGEGACALLVEPMEEAQSRGANIYAEIAGCGQSTDMTLPPEIDKSGESLARAVGRAILDANISPDEISVVCGTSWGTNAINEKEINAIRIIFGGRKYPVPVMNTNTHYGFIEATSGVLSISSAIASICRQAVYPTHFNEENFLSGDDYFFVKDKLLPAQIDYALVIGSSEDGSNYAVVVKRWC